MNVISQQVTICNKLGLHARAATKLAQLSQKFAAKITLELAGKEADAGSIMALMLLAGGQGKMVNITAQGKDAQLALAEICQLISDKFDEAE
ncbi:MULTISPECIES: HPr family phosphocarrier protein [Colwellia]|uniref:Phosphocarrier protein NPr n=1 Tax=Colwellia psychrerythraea (strain 34H / ATCC BAA-681) TaxID=167879 RepID=Q47VH7_COLP3|nr:MULTISPECIES: HPr family phosphocarrier protein [Colwellia]AAZ27415.1 phosphocarrier protein NPr [Colwellia psychrerythraea 34H]PKH85676.1 HPr family phosphocarrier protein [Colwellia sp. Bg11-28]